MDEISVDSRPLLVFSIFAIVLVFFNDGRDVVLIEHIFDASLARITLELIVRRAPSFPLREFCDARQLPDCSSFCSKSARGVRTSMRRFVRPV